MTTGTTGTSGAPSSGFVGSRSYRNWVGADGKFEVYEGFNRPKWNSYTTTDCRLLASGGKIGYYCPKGGGHVIQYAVPYSYYHNSVTGSNLPAFSTSDRNSLLAKIATASKESAFYAPNALAQPTKIVDMCVQNLGRLGRSFMALRHGDFVTAARQLGATRPRRGRFYNNAYGVLTPKDLADRWLELQYGWKPLLSDTYEACKAYEARTSRPKSQRFTKQGTKSGTQDVLGAVAKDRIKLSQKRRLSYSYERTEMLSLPRSMGLYDPLSLAWEVLPWSFVVDWFVPIGTYLQNLNQIPFLSGRWLVTESKITSGANGYITGGSFPFCDTHTTTKYTSVAFFPSCHYSCTESVRSALGSPPAVPFPTYKLGGAVHGTRVGNAISLAYTRFLGKNKLLESSRS